MQPKPRPFYSIPEAAAKLGIHRVTAWKMARDLGALYGVPVVQSTRTRVVVSRAAIDRLVADRDDTETAA